MDDPSVQEGRIDSDSSAASTIDTDQRNREDPPAVVSGRATQELSY